MKKEDGQEYDNRFMADALHTLKNMIASVNVYVEMVQYGHVNPQQLQPVLDKINHCTNSATRLCTDLMDICRVRGGLTDKRKGKVNPHQQMEEFIYMMEDDLQPKNISIVNKLDPEVHVLFNASMLTSIFRNLITNSIKFSPENSTITITGECPDAENYAISISDEGVGIDEKKVEEKLQYCTEYSTLGTQKEPGTGLGLILVKAILDKNNGSIRAYNNKNKGASFVITLPLYVENR